MAHEARILERRPLIVGRGVATVRERERKFVEPAIGHDAVFRARRAAESSGADGAGRKGQEIDIISVVPGRYPEDLLDLNPYRSLPTLVDRDLVLYDARVIIDYLDERFPHPPLMPVDPVLRAQFRLAMYRVERDWYGLAEQIEREPTARTRRGSRRYCSTRCWRAPICSRSSRSF